MTRSREVAVCALLLLLLVPACSMTPEQRHQVFGSLAGAAAGAGIGALAGGPRGALIGAAAGAVTGWAAVKLVQYHAEQVRSAREENKVFGVTEPQTTRVVIRGVTATPERVKPGQNVHLETEYGLVAPTDAGSVEVSESVELWKDGKLLTTMPAVRVQREPGGWVTRASIPVPKGAERGTYVVKSKIKGGTSRSVSETHFIVS